MALYTDVLMELGGQPVLTLTYNDAIRETIARPTGNVDYDAIVGYKVENPTDKLLTIQIFKDGVLKVSLTLGPSEVVEDNLNPSQRFTLRGVSFSLVVG